MSGPTLASPDPHLASLATPRGRVESSLTTVLNSWGQILGFLIFISWAVGPASADDAQARVDRVALGDQKITARSFFDITYRVPQSNEAAAASLADLFLPVADPSEVSESNDLQRIQFKGKRRPAILVVHGGGWITGDKWTLGGLCNEFAASGFVVLNINYRLAPQHKFPAQVDDVREGLIYLVKHADRLKIDVDRIGTYGYSAGGHLTSLVGVLGNEPLPEQAIASEWDPGDLRWNQIPPVLGICAGGPPCDFRSLPLKNESFTYFLGGTREALPELYNAASPLAYVSAGDPPIQIIHGEKDLLVPLKGSLQFAAAFEIAGVPADLKVIENHGHILTMMHPQTRATAMAFFQRMFGR